MSPRTPKSPVDKLRALLKKHELPQVGAAKLLGIDGRTVRRWLQDPGTPGFRECPAWAPQLLEVKLLKEDN